MGFATGGRAMSDAIDCDYCGIWVDQPWHDCPLKNSPCGKVQAELAALRADFEARRMYVELLTMERDAAVQSNEALRARVAEYERALLWIAAGKSTLPRDYATTAEFALQRASASAGPVQTNIPNGAVSVVKPQGTEETGTDRPAAPVLRCDHCGHEQPSGGFSELGCPKEYFDGISDVKCMGWMRPLQRQGTGDT